MRRRVTTLGWILAGIVLALWGAAPARADFAGFLAALWPDARAAGVSRATFDAAFRGVTPDPRVKALTRRQAEFVRPIWSYLDGAVSEERIASGRGMAGRHAAALSRAERQTGVPASVVLAIWGMETSYGGFTGSMNVIRSLATLAEARYRGTFFRDELIEALLILEAGEAELSDLKGSWAGAMGQTQFMPSSFRKYAVDFDGDGVKDIWSSATDAIGSTANYLAQHGWRAGIPWGVEAALPEGFDYRFADRTRMRPFSEWASLGLRRAAGGALPAQGEASLFLPAGHRGPAFLVTENFDVIKKYNMSDAYALAVGHLSDRIAGRGALVRPWPRKDPQLTMAQAKTLQSLLAARGFPMGTIDGRIGTNSRQQVRAYQLQAGLLADGHPTPALLDRLEREAGRARPAASAR